MEKKISKSIKIAVIGPESSGKSTLVKELASYYNAAYISEFARKYLTETNGFYERKTLDFILAEQLQLEQSKLFEPLLFCDTSPIDLKVWTTYKYKKVSRFIQKKVKELDYDFILLLKPDLKHEKDLLRENSTQKNRDELYSLFHIETVKSNIPFFIVEGKESIRLKNAINALSNHFSI